MIIKNLNKLFIATALMAFGFVSCNNAEESESTEEPKEQVKEEEKVEEPKEVHCHCPLDMSLDGELTQGCYAFSNGQVAMICGWAKDSLLSEFIVLDEEGNGVSEEYGALQTCLANFNSDTLELIELKYLPVSMSGSFDWVPIGRELIVMSGDQLTSLGLHPRFVSPDISLEEQNEYLDQINLDEVEGTEWAYLIANLEVLALMNNPSAKELLFNLETLTGVETDGAVSEQYADAVALVNWVER